MAFNRLPNEFSQVRVAILDDKPHEVETLISSLKEEGYAVEYFQDRRNFFDAIARQVYAIQLIDISLTKADTDGFEVARRAAEIDPQALRVCISKKLDDIYAKQVVDSLNPQQKHDGRIPLSLSDALGVRNFWAFHDKRDDARDLIKLARNFRIMSGCGDQVEISVDDALLRDFETHFGTIHLDEDGDSASMEVQFVEVVRQLARRPSQPHVSRIRLQKIGKGRSKTVVAHLSIELQSEHDARKQGEFTIDAQKIIKIGRLASIEREVSNYEKEIPKLFGSMFCPTIEAVGRSRTLAGLAYSRIVDINRKDVAPTLLDCLYGQSATVKASEAKIAFKTAFSFRRDCEVTGNKHGRSLLAAYQDRFKSLAPHGTSSGRNLLDGLLEYANNCLVEAGVLQEHGGIRSFPVEAHSLGIRESINSVSQLVMSYAAYETFYTALCHGDLHLDNMLMVKQVQQSSPISIYIDFADVGTHHVLLDYVVMELALRFQSLRYLLDSTDVAVLDKYKLEIIRHLHKFESALQRGRKRWPSSGKEIEDLPIDIQVWLKNTTRLILDIRKHTELFLKTEFPSKLEVYLSRNSPHESAKGVSDEVDKERARFECGLGLASLAAMSLPQEEGISMIHKTWFGMLGQMLLLKFNAWKHRSTPQ